MFDSFRPKCKKNKKIKIKQNKIIKKLLSKASDDEKANKPAKESRVNMFQWSRRSNRRWDFLQLPEHKILT